MPGMNFFDSIAARRATVMLLAAISLAGMGCAPRPSRTTPVIEGVVEDRDGDAYAGAMVKITHAELPLVHMVVSGERGRFVTPSLPVGQYSVQAIGGRYASDSAGPVEVAGDHGAELQLTLASPRVIAPIATPMQDADYEELMPDGAAKRLLATRCTTCHGLERIVPQRWTRDHWRSAVEKMSYYLSDPDTPGNALSEGERNRAVNYLAEHFSPETPPLDDPNATDDLNAKLPSTPLTGAALRYVAMEYHLDGVAGVHDMAVDSRGVVWVSEEDPEGMLGRFDPVAHQYERIRLPLAEAEVRDTGAIWVDEGDHVWVSDNGLNREWFRYEPESEIFQSYAVPVPARMAASVNTLPPIRTEASGAPASLPAGWCGSIRRPPRSAISPSRAAGILTVLRLTPMAISGSWPATATPSASWMW